MHMHISSGIRDLTFGLSFHALPYFVCSSSECSCETARLGRLVNAFADHHICDKYQNLTSFLIY